MGKLIRFKIVFLLISLTRGDEIDDAIKSCLFGILNEYFPNKPFLAIADMAPYSDGTEQNRTLVPQPRTDDFPVEIIREIMNEQKWTLQIFNMDNDLRPPAREKLKRVNNSVVFLREDDVTSDMLLEWTTKRMKQFPLWNPGGRTLAVVKSETRVGDGSELARRVIEGLWKKAKAADNLVMVAEASGVVRFYTWFPYKQPDCSEVKEVVLLNTFRGGGFLQETHLFPEKVSPDLEGCRLLAVTDECIPYVLGPDEETGNYTDGFEFQVIYSIAKAMNFALTSFSSTGTISGMLQQQEADLGFGCRWLNEDLHLRILALPAYSFDSLAWFVPSPSYKSHVTDIFRTFPARFWLVTISVMSAAVLVVIPLIYVERESKDWGTYVGYILKLVGVSLYGPVVLPTERSNFRLFVFSFFVYSLHITIAFQSSLLALYRESPYLRQYTSLREAVDDGVFVYISQYEESKVNQSDHDIWAKILQPDRHCFFDNVTAVFDAIAEEKSAIALFPKMTGIHTVFEDFKDPLGRPKILWLEEPFAPLRFHMLLSPGNPLYSLLQRHILQLTATGLMSLWLNQYVYEGTRWDDEEGRHQDYANAPLTMAQMGGAFFLLSLFLTVAVVVFIAEICVFHLSDKLKVKKNRRPLYPPLRPKGKPIGFVGEKFLQ